MLGTLLLVRHGESLANAGTATADPETIPLTVIGEGQAQEVANAVEIRPDLIVTSPFTRARQTSIPLCRKFPEVRTEIWAVQEYVFVNLRDSPATTAFDRRSLADAFWSRGDPCEKHPGAESFVEFWGRVTTFNQQVGQFSGKYLVVFTHGVSVYRMSGCAIGWGARSMSASTSIAEIERSLAVRRMLMMTACA
jgi:2,3-bisphosphoglycerate-dependent phosphoglycerate mutase